MPIKLLILGLPRSGTTIVYELLARSNPDKIFLYEPFFRPLTIKARHDYLAVTECALVNKFVCSHIKVIYSLLDRYQERGKRFISKKIISLLEQLHQLRPELVIKDIFIWTILEDIIRDSSLQDTKVLITVRDYIKLKRSLLLKYITRKNIIRKIKYILKFNKGIISKKAIDIYIKEKGNIPNLFEFYNYFKFESFFINCITMIKFLYPGLELNLKADLENYKKLLTLLVKSFIEKLNYVREQDNMNRVLIISNEELRRYPIKTFKKIEKFSGLKIDKELVELILPPE